MAKVRLVDYFGFTLYETEIQTPFPRVLVWGDEFFLLNLEDVEAKEESPRYNMTSGFVLDETKATPKY